MPTPTVKSVLFPRAEHGLVSIESDMRHQVRIIRIEYTRVHVRVIYRISATRAAA